MAQRAQPVGHARSQCHWRERRWAGQRSLCPYFLWSHAPARMPATATRAMNQVVPRKSARIILCLSAPLGAFERRVELRVRPEQRDEFPVPLGTGGV